MRRTFYLILFLMLASLMQAQQAKYVFYFIGDGMGVNQVNGTEMYLGELEGNIQAKPLLFATFPVTGMATTYSLTNSITDSAAGGTALATGSKTYNGALGVDIDGNPLVSIAERAKKSGYRVGVTTSVSVDHATPGAFYAHQANRSYYYEVALDLTKSGFDFFAGSGFLKPHTNKDKQEVPEILPIIEEAGYTVARGVEEYRAKAATAKKMLLIQQEGADPASLPYAIDQKEGDLTLKQITESAVDFLTKGSSKGFFLMVEGGKIDWACHANDGATTFKEVIDMNEAVKVAYEFYKKHPKETLIVITADHETGGLGLGNSDYTLNLKVLASQQQSLDGLSRSITDLRKDENASWEKAKALLTEQMGFWKDVPLTWKQERRLHDIYEASFVEHTVEFTETLYSRTEPLASAAKEVLNEIAKLGWTTGAHSAGFVPVIAIGAGSKAFIGIMDNTDIPKRIAKAAGYR